MTSVNSSNSSANEELRSLILDYITAYNNDEHSLAEQLLFKIEQLKKNESND